MMETSVPVAGSTAETFTARPTRTNSKITSRPSATLCPACVPPLKFDDGEF